MLLGLFSYLLSRNVRAHVEDRLENKEFQKNQKKLKKGIDKQIIMLYNIKACTCCELPYEALDH